MSGSGTSVESLGACYRAAETPLDFAVERFGLRDTADTLQLGSPFDFRRQALLVLASGLADPREPLFVDQAADTQSRGAEGQDDDRDGSHHRSGTDAGHGGPGDPRAIFSACFPQVTLEGPAIVT